MSGRSKAIESAKSVVASWLEGEQNCVTSQRVAQTLGLSLKESSDLLQDILLSSLLPSKLKIKVTVCQQLRENGTTVFRLKQFDSFTKENVNHSISIFALTPLAPDGTIEKVSTALERDVLEWRQNNGTSTRPSIQPADEIQNEMKGLVLGNDRPSASDFASSAAQHKRDNATAAAATRKPFANAKATKTTAAAFFSQHAKKNPDSKTATTAKKAASTKSKSAASSSKSMFAASQSKEPKKSTITKTSSKAPSKGTVGDADDFIGDMDDGDESEEEVVPVKPPRAKRPIVASKKQQQLEKDDEDDDEEEDESPKENVEMEDISPPPSPLRGAMDSFTTLKLKPKKDSNSQDSNGGSKKRKRRVLVEKTTMVKGYLRTEMQTVWEDIPSDDEEEEQKQKAAAKNKKTKAKPKSTTGMKQKSLMGFFSSSQK